MKQENTQTEQREEKGIVTNFLADISNAINFAKVDANIREQFIPVCLKMFNANAFDNCNEIEEEIERLRVAIKNDPDVESLRGETGSIYLIKIWIEKKLENCRPEERMQLLEKIWNDEKAKIPAFFYAHKIVVIEEKIKEIKLRKNSKSIEKLTDEFYTKIIQENSLFPKIEKSVFLEQLRRK